MGALAGQRKLGQNSRVDLSDRVSKKEYWSSWPSWPTWPCGRGAGADGQVGQQGQVDQQDRVSQPRPRSNRADTRCRLARPRRSLVKGDHREPGIRQLDFQMAPDAVRRTKRLPAMRGFGRLLLRCGRVRASWLQQASKPVSCAGSCAISLGTFLLGDAYRPGGCMVASPLRRVPADWARSKTCSLVAASTAAAMSRSGSWELARRWPPCRKAASW